MPTLVQSQSQVVDALLTNVVIGYPMQELAWLPTLFPRVPVNLPSGKVIKFDMSDYVEFDTEKANNGDVKRRNFYFSDENYNCTEHALNGEVNYNQLRDLDRQNVPWSLQERAARSTYASIMLKGELKAATLATTPGTYASTNRITLSGSDNLTNSSADLIGIVNDARGAIQIGCGMFPNVGVFPWDAFTAAINLPQIVERYNAVIAPGQIAGIDKQAEVLAAILGLDRIKVVQSLKRNARTGVNERIGGAGNIVLAYVPDGGTTDIYTPSFGYMYGLSGYPFVKPVITDDENDKYLYPVRDEFDVAITDQNAGYLISGAV